MAPGPMSLLSAKPFPGPPPPRVAAVLREGPQGPRTARSRRRSRPARPRPGRGGAGHAGSCSPAGGRGRRRERAAYRSRRAPRGGEVPGCARRRKRSGSLRGRPSCAAASRARGARQHRSRIPPTGAHHARTPAGGLRLRRHQPLRPAL